MKLSDRTQCKVKKAPEKCCGSLEYIFISSISRNLDESQGRETDCPNEIVNNNCN